MTRRCDKRCIGAAVTSTERSKHFTLQTLHFAMHKSAVRRQTSFVNGLVQNVRRALANVTFAGNTPAIWTISKTLYAILLHYTNNNDSAPRRGRWTIEVCSELSNYIDLQKSRKPFGENAELLRFFSEESEVNIYFLSIRIKFCCSVPRSFDLI
jgi:hypothetical protein